MIVGEHDHYPILLGARQAAALPGVTFGLPTPDAQAARNSQASVQSPCRR
ncbi:MAG: hypothetical protein QM682_13290 [Paracoccus sp. (in: a-proteobacteria)]